MCITAKSCGVSANGGSQHYLWEDACLHDNAKLYTESENISTAIAGMRAVSTRQQSQKLCYMDMTDEFVPLSQQKKGKSVAQPAASGAAPSGQHLSRKQRKANRQAQQTQGPAKGGGRGRGASGGVQKKKGGKFAQRKRHTT